MTAPSKRKWPWRMIIAATACAILLGGLFVALTVISGGATLPIVAALLGGLFLGGGLGASVGYLMEKRQEMLTPIEDPMHPHAPPSHDHENMLASISEKPSNTFSPQYSSVAVPKVDHVSPLQSFKAWWKRHMH